MLFFPEARTSTRVQQCWGWLCKQADCIMAKIPGAGKSHRPRERTGHMFLQTKTNQAVCIAGLSNAAAFKHRTWKQDRAYNILLAFSTHLLSYHDGNAVEIFICRLKLKMTFILQKDRHYVNCIPSLTDKSFSKLFFFPPLVVNIRMMSL